MAGLQAGTLDQAQVAAQLGLSRARLQLLADRITDRLKQRLEAAPELSIFLSRDHGSLLGIYGHMKRAVQYEIGNPLARQTLASKWRLAPSA
jgi:hypothetical protein